MPNTTDSIVKVIPTVLALGILQKTIKLTKPKELRLRR